MERKPNSIRVDKWLKQRFPSLSGRQVNEAIESGLVLGETGQRTSKGAYMDSGSLLDCQRLEAQLNKLKEGEMELQVSIIAETADYVLIDKPAGMPSHPLSLFDSNTVTHWALARYPGILKEFTEIQPTIVPHRLDTGTSGLIIVAKHRKAYEEWREKFQRKQVSKKYLAWCWGKPPENVFEIHYSIAHAQGDSTKMVTPATQPRYSPPVQEAESIVRVLECHGEAFLAEVTCSTGVTHQVRVHLASRGFPLIGDPLYDTGFEKRSFRPAHHLLRAIVRHAQDVWKADRTEFLAVKKQF